MSILPKIIAVIFTAATTFSTIIQGLKVCIDISNYYRQRSQPQPRVKFPKSLLLFTGILLILSLISGYVTNVVLADNFSSQFNSAQAAKTIPTPSGRPASTAQLNQTPHIGLTPTPTSVISTYQTPPSYTPTPPNNTSKPIPTTESVPTTTTPKAIPPVNDVYEAEDVPPNTLGEHAYVDSETCSKCSGGKLVFNIGTAPGPTSGTFYYNGTLQFNNISAPQDGAYSLTIFYCDYYRSDTDVYISVNGANAFKLHYPAVGNCRDNTTPVGQITCQIFLHQGSSNTLQFANPYDFSSYIDKIIIKSL